MAAAVSLRASSVTNFFPPPPEAYRPKLVRGPHSSADGLQ